MKNELNNLINSINIKDRINISRDLAILTQKINQDKIDIKTQSITLTAIEILLERLEQVVCSDYALTISNIGNLVLDVKSNLNKIIGE